MKRLLCYGIISIILYSSCSNHEDNLHKDGDNLQDNLHKDGDSLQDSLHKDEYRLYKECSWEKYFNCYYTCDQEIAMDWRAKLPNSNTRGIALDTLFSLFIIPTESEITNCKTTTYAGLCSSYVYYEILQPNPSLCAQKCNELNCELEANGIEKTVKKYISLTAWREKSDQLIYVLNNMQRFNNEWICNQRCDDANWKAIQECSKISLNRQIDCKNAANKAEKTCKDRCEAICQYIP